MGYAKSEDLNEADADRYASAFAIAKGWGLDNRAAQGYASGYLYHWYMARTSTESTAEVQSAITEYATVFEAAITGSGDGAIADALGKASESMRMRREWQPFNRVAQGSTPFAQAYAAGYDKSAEVGVLAHGYASIYASWIYDGSEEETAVDWANAQVRGLKQSEPGSLDKRLEYAHIYLIGYSEALWRVDQGYTIEHKVESWATAYAQSYNTGYQRARKNGWDDPESAAHTYARLFAYGKVDLSFPDQSAFLNADSYFRGVNAAQERVLDGDAASSYAWDYYFAYFDTKVQRGWSENRADAYAVAFAEAKLNGREEENAKQYARVYEKAFTEAKEGGSTDAEAHVYAAAFAEAEAGPAPTPTPMPQERTG